jgi:hypothetical protein
VRLGCPSNHKTQSEDGKKLFEAQNHWEYSLMGALSDRQTWCRQSGIVAKNGIRFAADSGPRTSRDLTSRKALRPGPSPDPGSRIQDRESRIANSGTPIQDRESRNANSGTRIQDREFRIANWRETFSLFLLSLFEWICFDPEHLNSPLIGEDREIGR